MAEVVRTELVAILDRSGSMSGTIDEARNAYNEFLRKHQEVGDASLTLVTFDDQIEWLADGAPIKEVKPLTKENFSARGMTKLADAVGTTISKVADRLSREMREEPRCPHCDRTAVLVYIITDGYENASREWTLDRVRERIVDLRQQSWDFTFLGSDLSTVATAANMGISLANTAQYVASVGGTQACGQGLIRNSLRARNLAEMGGTVCSAFTDEERVAIEGAE